MIHCESIAKPNIVIPVETGIQYWIPNQVGDDTPSVIASGSEAISSYKEIATPLEDIGPSPAEAGAMAREGGARNDVELDEIATIWNGESIPLQDGPEARRCEAQGKNSAGFLTVLQRYTLGVRG